MLLPHFSNIAMTNSIKVEVSEIVKAMKKNSKSSGQDRLNSELYKYTGVRLAVLLSLLYTACINIVHGYLPKELLDYC